MVNLFPLEIDYPKKGHYLLRALQEKESYRIGWQILVKVDVGIISATNCILGNIVAEGAFRSDLFYRLNIFSKFLKKHIETKESL